MMKNEGSGMRMAFRIASTTDLDTVVYKSDTTTVHIPQVGVELHSTDSFGNMTLRNILEHTIKTISPSLGMTAAGASILTRLNLYLFHSSHDDAETKSDPWILVLDDPWSLLKVVTSDGASFWGSKCRALAIPSAFQRMPYRLKLVQVNKHGQSTSPALSIRIAEQPGRGIGSLTFAGAIILANHLSTCFPNGYWKGKRILELGAGAGTFGILMAALGCHVVVTDRPEYMELIEMNAKLNAKLLQQSGGHVQAMVLDWINTDLDQFNTISFDHVVGADIIYPHERHMEEIMTGLIRCLDKLLQGNVSALIHHSYRGGTGESGFFDRIDQDFNLSRVQQFPSSHLPKKYLDFFNNLPASNKLEPFCGCQLNFKNNIKIVASPSPVEPYTSEELESASEKDFASLEKWAENEIQDTNDEIDDSAKSSSSNICESSEQKLETRLLDAFEDFEARYEGHGIEEDFSWSEIPCAIYRITLKS